MSISKRINWTRIVLPLLTVLLASSFLLSEKTQEWGLFKLTQSKAYVNAFDDVQTFRIIDSQWESSDPASYEYKAFAFTGDGKASYTAVGCSFTSAYSGDVELEYTVEIFDYYNNRVYMCPIYAEMGERLDFGLPKVDATTDITYRVRLYVRRKDGENMYKSDMYASSFTMYYVRDEEVSDNTLPADWLATTTASYPQYTTYTTIATTVEYDSLVTTLTVPSDVRAGIAQFEEIIYYLWNLHYMPFIIIFAIIIGLCAWLLH